MTGNLPMNDSAADAPQTVALTGVGIAGVGLSISAEGSSNASVLAGQSANYKLSIGGPVLNGTALLSCSGAPRGAQCSLPASESSSAVTATDFVVTVTTTSRTVASLHSMHVSLWTWAIALLSWEQPRG